MSPAQIFEKYKDLDVRNAEIRTSLLTELEPLIVGTPITRYDYRHRGTKYIIVSADDVFDYLGYEQEPGTPEVFYKDTHYMYGVSGRYVLVYATYTTPKKNLVRHRSLRLLFNEKGLETSC
jgi:hypothetical protein